MGSRIVYFKAHASQIEGTVKPIAGAMWRGVTCHGVAVPPFSGIAADATWRGVARVFFFADTTDSLLRFYLHFRSGMVRLRRAMQSLGAC